MNKSYYLLISIALILIGSYLFLHPLLEKRPVEQEAKLVGFPFGGGTAEVSGYANIPGKYDLLVKTRTSAPSISEGSIPCPTIVSISPSEPDENHFAADTINFYAEMHSDALNSNVGIWRYDFPLDLSKGRFQIRLKISPACNDKRLEGATLKMGERGQDAFETAASQLLFMLGVALLSSGVFLLVKMKGNAI